MQELIGRILFSDEIRVWTIVDKKYLGIDKNLEKLSPLVKIFVYTLNIKV